MICIAVCNIHYYIIGLFQYISLFYIFYISLRPVVELYTLKPWMFLISVCLTLQFSVGYCNNCSEPWWTREITIQLIRKLQSRTKEWSTTLSSPFTKSPSHQRVLASPPPRTLVTFHTLECCRHPNTESWNSRAVYGERAGGHTWPLVNAIPQVIRGRAIPTQFASNSIGRRPIVEIHGSIGTNCADEQIQLREVFPFSNNTNMTIN